MIGLWIGGALALLAVYLGSLFVRGEIRRLVRSLRWIVGLAMVGAGALLGARGQLMLASLLAAGGAGVLMRGRLGPIDFGAGLSSPNNASSVSSRYFAMRLEHETGAVSGKVRQGPYAGRELADLSADECWALLNAVSEDPDSRALFVSWLDANRAGWRDHFASEFGMDEDGDDSASQQTGTASVGSMAEAYEVLGLEPGASAAAIRAAHRALMKKVHPDAGGSAFLAARINQAKDVLLKKSQHKA